jgi:acetyl esterase/lipase
MSKNMWERLNPEFAGPLKMMQMPGGQMRFDDIPAARAESGKMMAAMKQFNPVIKGVTSEDRRIPGPEGAPEVAIRIYRPEKQTGVLPALLWIHGGGYMLGNIEQEDILVKKLTLAGDCVVVSVDYRLAPENPFPAPLEDCYAALKWLAAHAKELNIDKKRIAIGGASAGGGLTAGLALLARDRNEVNIVFQYLIYPMLDDRTTKPASATCPDALFWTRESNLIGWKSYLGCKPGGKNTSCYASAPRATDLTGLPPAYIAVGELDLFAQEDIDYAQRLIQACVPTELHVYPGVCHAFDMMVPDSSVAKQFSTDFNRALKQGLHRE